MGARENPVQRACFDLLTVCGVFCWRQNTGAFSLPDPTRRSGKRFVRSGIGGTPDIIGVVPKGPHRGKFLGVEAKAPAEAGLPGLTRRKAPGKQSDDQKAFQSRLEAAGGIYLLVHSSEQLEAWLKQNGVL